MAAKDVTGIFILRTSDNLLRHVDEALVRQSRTLIKLTKLVISGPDGPLVPDPEPVDLPSITAESLDAVIRWYTFNRSLSRVSMMDWEQLFFTSLSIAARNAAFEAAKFLKIEPMRRSMERFAMVRGGGEDTSLVAVRNFVARGFLRSKSPRPLRKKDDKYHPGPSRLRVMSSSDPNQQQSDGSSSSSSSSSSSRELKRKVAEIAGDSDMSPPIWFKKSVSSSRIL